jgi:hypothetical protein
VTIDIARLRALALAAPAGPWRAGGSSGYNNPNVSNADGPIFSTGNARKRSRSSRAAAAQYTAAIDPQTLLALLDVLEAQQ